MRTERGPVTQLCRVDASSVAAWVSAIPFERWPQQHRLADGRLRPAMVNDLAWEGFGAATDALVALLMARLAEMAESAIPWIGLGQRDLTIAAALFDDYGRMLSVVMPGHEIPAHCDAQPTEWVTRVHVPLATNARATMSMRPRPGSLMQWHLKSGWAYLVDTRVEHAVRNDGDTPRVHVMFDVRRSG